MTNGTWNNIAIRWRDPSPANATAYSPDATIGLEVGATIRWVPQLGGCQVNEKTRNEEHYTLPLVFEGVEVQIF